MQPTDDELLIAWRQGDNEAGNALLSRHFDALYRFFRNKVGADADELVQRTMLSCAESHTRIRGESSFRTYLFTIARNALYRFLRQRSSQAERLDFGVTSISDIRTSLTGRLAKAETREALEMALARLPIDDQILIELFYTEGLDSKALSEVLGIEASSVRSRLQRARGALEQMLHEHSA